MKIMMDYSLFQLVWGHKPQNNAANYDMCLPDRLATTSQTIVMESVTPSVFRYIRHTNNDGNYDTSFGNNDTSRSRFLQDQGGREGGTERSLSA